jgi:hypothetical protein
MLLLKALSVKNLISVCNLINIDSISPKALDGVQMTSLLRPVWRHVARLVCDVSRDVETTIASWFQ